MKHILFILLTSTLLSSCASTFYYSTISTLNEDIAQTDEGDFVTENDSLLIAYWFNGRNAPIYINVYNKSETPLYIDWDKSSLIINGAATSYKNRVVNMSDEYDVGYQQEITLNSKSETSFIPPRSRSTFRTAHLANFNYDKLKDRMFKKSTIPQKNGESTDIKILQFTSDNTPLRFRSYLTLHKKAGNPFSMEQEFYISSLMKSTYLTPKNMTTDLFKRGDMFYIEKENKNKGLGEALLGTSLILGTIVIDVALSNDYCY